MLQMCVFLVPVQAYQAVCSDDHAMYIHAVLFGRMGSNSCAALRQPSTSVGRLKGPQLLKEVDNEMWLSFRN